MEAKKSRGQKRKQQNLLVQSNYEYIKTNVRREGNAVLIHRHRFQFPIEANSRLKGHTCVPFQRMKRVNVGELLKYHPSDKPLYTNGPWTSFFRSGGEEWTTKGTTPSYQDRCGHYCERWPAVGETTSATTNL